MLFFDSFNKKKKYISDTQSVYCIRDMLVHWNILHLDKIRWCLVGGLVQKHLFSFMLYYLSDTTDILVKSLWSSLLLLLLKPHSAILDIFGVSVNICSLWRGLILCCINVNMVLQMCNLILFIFFTYFCKLYFSWTSAKYLGLVVILKSICANRIWTLFTKHAWGIFWGEHISWRLLPPLREKKKFQYLFPSTVHCHFLKKL